MGKEKITLVCTSLGENPNLFSRMLHTAIEFDEIILHTNTRSIVRINHYEEHETPFHLPIPNAYNRIINSLVETEWICCFADDDYFYPDGLSKMIAEVHKGIDADVVHFKFRVSGYMPKEDVRGRIHRRLTGQSEYILWEKNPVTPKLLKRHGRIPAASFFRKSAWEKVGGFQGDKFHDWDLWKRMAETGCKFKYFDNLVYNYVRRNKSAWIKQNEKYS